MAKYWDHVERVIEGERLAVIGGMLACLSGKKGHTPEVPTGPSAG
jgi:hypothetical protein